MPTAKVLAFQARREFPEPRCEDSFEAICRYASQFLIEVVPFRFTGVAGFWLFDSAVAYFLDHDFTHLFVGADDLIYPAFTIPRLAGDGKDIVSGVYPRRQPDPIIPAIKLGTQEEINERIEGKALIQVEWLGFHTMMICRRVLEKMVTDYPELKYEDQLIHKPHWALSLPMIFENRILYLDDWAFCSRAKKSGFQLWVDFGVSCEHLLPPSFVGFPRSKEAQNVNR